jgi:hypothetical protein
LTKETAILFDGKTFCVRLESPGVIEFVELPGESTLPSAVNTADKMGYISTHWYNYRGDKIQLPKSIVRSNGAKAIVSAIEQGLCTVETHRLTKIDISTFNGLPKRDPTDVAERICEARGWVFQSLSLDWTEFEYTVPGMMTSELWCPLP